MMTNYNKDVPPMVDYVVKMMLLEGIRCYKSNEIDALTWIQTRLQDLGDRLEELRDRGK